MSHEQTPPDSDQGPMAKAVELLKQPDVRIKLAAALTQIEDEKRGVVEGGAPLRQVGRYISATGKLFDVNGTPDPSRYTVWEYSLGDTAEAGSLKRDLGVLPTQHRNGIIKLGAPLPEVDTPATVSLTSTSRETAIDSNGTITTTYTFALPHSLVLRLPDITLDLLNPERITVGRDTPALEATTMLQKIGVMPALEA